MLVRNSLFYGIGPKFKIAPFRPGQFVVNDRLADIRRDLPYFVLDAAC